MSKRAVSERSRRELSLDVSVGVHILLVVEQSSLESQSRGCAKTPILTVCCWWATIHPAGTVIFRSTLHDTDRYKGSSLDKQCSRRDPKSRLFPFVPCFSLASFNLHASSLDRTQGSKKANRQTRTDIT